MNKDAFFKYVETRAQNAYGSALLVKKSNETKYSLLIASESVPAVFGSKNTFEFNLINSKTVGKVGDKISLEEKDVEFLLHRDNVYRLEQLKGQTLDFMYFTPDFMGWKFVGEIDYRPNDATADILRGTYTITPTSADTAPIMDARSLIMETITITNSIPDSLQLKESTTVTDGEEITIECDVDSVTVAVDIVDGATGTTITKFGSSTTNATASTPAKVTLSGLSATVADYGIAYITVSKTGYAPWTTSIALQGSKAVPQS